MPLRMLQEALITVHIAIGFSYLVSEYNFRQAVLKSLDARCNVQIRERSDKKLYNMIDVLREGSMR